MCEEGIFLIDEAVETGQKEYEIEKRRNLGTEKTERLVTVTRNMSPLLAKRSPNLPRACIIFCLAKSGFLHSEKEIYRTAWPEAK